MNATATITTRPVTAAEAEVDAHKPTHRRAVTVEINTDGRATIGRAKTVHRATVWTYLNSHDESTGRLVFVDCGSRRYRNTDGKGDTATATSPRYDVDCTRCLAG